MTASGQLAPAEHPWVRKTVDLDGWCSGIPQDTEGGALKGWDRSYGRGKKAKGASFREERAAVL